MTTPLQKTAQAVIDRWDSPAWKDQPHTADYINELRKALTAELSRPESTVVSLMRAENVALKDAARLALDALLPFGGHGLIMVNQAIAALQEAL